MLADLRFAVRQLLKSPGFTTVAVLSLALGIGANTAIFSLVNEFLLRMLPVRNPEELVLFRQIRPAQGAGMQRSEMGNSYTDPATGRTTGTSFSVLAFQRFRDHRPAAVSDVFAFTNFYQVNVLIDGQPEAGISAQMVSGDYFKGLGVHAAAGRVLSREDDQLAAPAVAVISHRYWQKRFARDPGVIGRTIHVNQVPVTIIGVSAPGFNGTGQAGESTDLSVPLAHHPRFLAANPDLAKAWSWWIRIMGRLAPGFTGTQAAASLEPIFQQAAREGWEEGRSLDRAPQPSPNPPNLVADPGGQGENDNRRHQGPTLRILMGLVSLVLLAACANVANLLLARGAGRRREIAVRLALGASRARIVRQLLAESLLLALLGAGLGALFAGVGRGLLLALRPAGNSSALELPLDGRVLGFTVLVAVATAVVFGLAPALRATRLDLTAEFQGSARALGGARSRLSQALMIVQIALSIVLLVSTALCARTLRNLHAVDAGFNRGQLVMFRVDGVPAGYTQEKSNTLKLRLVERIQQIPGVRAATFSNIALLSRGRWGSSIAVRDFTPEKGASPSVHVNPLAPNFFQAMELPLLAGRGFSERDTLGAPKVAVVNQAFAQKFLGGRNPVGHTFNFGSRPSTDPKNFIEIIGYTRDAKYTGLRDPVQPTVYLSALQYPDDGANFLVRLAGEPGPFAAALRNALNEIDPALPVLNLRTMEDQLDRNHAQERLFAWLSGFFGVLALALACVGLYGLMSYGVVRRTGEIGLRMALGAVPTQVMRMILRESLALVSVGVVLGLAGAYAASRLIAAMLFGVSRSDPLTYGAVALVLFGVALAATLLPARRAARIEPMRALRTE
jgi:predicted permease